MAQKYLPVEWRDEYTLVVSGEGNNHRIIATNLDGPSQEEIEKLFNIITTEKRINRCEV